MRIVVQNEKEKELIRRFIRVLVEMDAIEEVEKLDHDTTGCIDVIFLQSDEYRLIRENLHSGMIHIDQTINEMTFDDSSIITGTCSKCETVTEGTSNDDDITYTEYLEYNSKEKQDNWLCESCYLTQKED